MYQLVYKLLVGGIFIDARLEDSLKLSFLQAQLSTLAVTGQAGVFYDAYLFTGDLSMMVAKSDLCMVVFNDMVATQDYSKIESSLKTVWANSFQGK